MSDWFEIRGEADVKDTLLVLSCSSTRTSATSVKRVTELRVWSTETKRKKKTETSATLYVDPRKKSMRH